jgi:hypothetical protein
MKKAMLCCLVAVFCAGCGRSEEIQVYRTDTDSVMIDYNHYEGFFESFGQDNRIVSVEYVIFLPNHSDYQRYEGYMAVRNYRAHTSVMVRVTRDGPALRNDCDLSDDELRQGYDPEGCRLVVAWRERLDLDRRVSEILRSPPPLSGLNPP